MSASTAIMRIILEDGGSSARSSPGSSTPSGQPHPSFLSGPSMAPRMPALIPMPPAPRVSKADAGFEDQIKAILGDRGLRKQGFTQDNLAKMDPGFVKSLYREVAPVPKPRKTTTQSRPPEPTTASRTPTVPEGRAVDFGPMLLELRGIRSAVEKGGVSRSPPPPKPLKVSYDDFMTLTPRKRPVTMQDFGFRPVASPVKPRPVAMPVERRSMALPTPSAFEPFKQFLPRSVQQGVSAFQNLKGPAKVPVPGGSAAAAGGEAGAASGMARMAAAAGPAVLALFAIEAGARLATKGMDLAAKGYEGAGRQAAMLAGNDHLGMFNSAIDTASETLHEIPIIGKVMAAQMQLFAAPVRAMTVASEAFIKRGEELARYSGPLAGAGARANVRGNMDDQREAQRLGGDIARLTDAWSQSRSDMRDLVLPFKEAVVKVLASIAETLADITSGLVYARDDAAKEGILLIDAVEQLAPDFLNQTGLIDLIEDIRRFLLPRAEARGPMAEILGAADGLGTRGGFHPGAAVPLPVMPGGVLPI